MARRKILDPEPDVKVKIRAGCPICGRTDQHTHAQDDWRAVLDAYDTDER